MRFASLGSGSRGNGTLIEAGSTCLLVDCGFTLRETEARLRRLGRTPEDLNAVLVTHEHSDHLAGVAALARKYRLPVRATVGTAMTVRRGARLADLPTFEAISPQQDITVGGIAIRPVLVPHDAREPCQFVFSSGGQSRSGRTLKTFGLLTDLGTITPLVVEAFGHCDALMLECNHDPAMLANGPYPPSLKRRVGGAWGHLSNTQAAGLLARVERARLQCVTMSHLSEQNNTVALATAALLPVLLGSDVLVAADQREGTAWHELA